MEDAWGIADGYWDTSGTWRQTPPETRDAILAAMGAADHPAGPPAGPPLWFVPSGDAAPLQGPAELVLEDGTSIRSVSSLPADLPLGYHELWPLDGGPVTHLVVTPRRCHLPDDLRAWGWAVQLYAARSRESWGIGDLADLRSLARWAAGLGAGVISLNPLHAAAPVVPQQPSPYFPTSRRWRNPLYLRVEEVPGATEAVAELEPLARAGRALNEAPLIDRDEVLRRKSDALELLWERFRRSGGDPAFDGWRSEQGGLAGFATYCALAEHHGPSWRAWPAEHRHPESPAVAAFAADHADRLRYHEWLQWLLDRQLAAAADEGVSLVQDLAVGFDPDGADAWAWQDLLASPGVRVGAPPDDFNTQGQDWGLPPFVPWRLRHALYRPFVETVRAGLRHAGGLRVDHAMGLFRLFWIPPGEGPPAGTYVRYPAGDLLDLLALESVRAGAFVVGEDLGTVEAGVREELTQRAVLSYRLFWFEPEPPERWPEQALAAVSTHDLPTIAGVWTGADLEAQRSLAMRPNEAVAGAMRQKLAEAVVAGDVGTWAGTDEGQPPVDDVVHATYRRLADAPCRVVVAALEDVLGAVERPNMPGTVDEWPNWSIPLPRPLDEVQADERVLGVAATLRGRHGGAGK